MTTTTDRTGGPAFPVTDSHHANGQIQYGTNGMTLRDYIATKAKQSFILCPPPSKEAAEKFNGFTVGEYISTKAYEMADEMLKVRAA